MFKLLFYIFVFIIAFRLFFYLFGGSIIRSIISGIQREFGNSTQSSRRSDPKATFTRNGLDIEVKDKPETKSPPSGMVEDVDYEEVK